MADPHKLLLHAVMPHADLNIHSKSMNPGLLSDSFNMHFNLVIASV